MTSGFRKVAIVGKTKHIFPVNRVEGDLEIRVEVEDGFVTDAWSIGTMFRGIENIMIDRALLDGLVITPRVCGICSTSHLKAAALALDVIFDVKAPDNAKRVRNAALMVEQMQNDIRHAFLLFMPDFANARYRDNPMYAEAVKRYAPLKGETAVQTIRESKRLLEIVSILGGQWPHSSFMVPGGVVSVPVESDIIQCRHLLKGFNLWFEKRILGCGIERFLEIKNEKELFAWLDECESHQNSDLGFFIRLSKMAGIDKTGAGHGNYISFGSYEMPERTSVMALNGGSSYLPPGFFSKGKITPFDHEKITEDLSFSFFDENSGAKHPFEGSTSPYIAGNAGRKYSWIKAPRYDGVPAETGPLAEMVIASNPLFGSILDINGPSAFVRELARFLRPAFIIPALDQWLKEIAAYKGGFYTGYKKPKICDGFGLVQAPRGALGHWVKVRDSKIKKYQIITPTAWNGSPRDLWNVRGPWEEALVGTQIKDINNPVEIEHIIRSFDPCLVCAVHVIQT